MGMTTLEKIHALDRMIMQFDLTTRYVLRSIYERWDGDKNNAGLEDCDYKFIDEMYAEHVEKKG